MAAILARVKQVLGRSPGEGNRVVVFSSFTSFLDLLVRTCIWRGRMGRFARALHSTDPPRTKNPESPTQQGAMLTQEGHAYQRLDGSTSREKRADITRAWGAASASPVGDDEDSSDDEEGGGVGGGRGRKKGGGPVQVLLVSIKAGGVGLNLTGASNVVIAEPFFNPCVPWLCGARR